eukprot:765819-Hanusia_phi.AAC.1
MQLMGRRTEEEAGIKRRWRIGELLSVPISARQLVYRGGAVHIKQEADMELWLEASEELQLRGASASSSMVQFRGKAHGR